MEFPGACSPSRSVVSKMTTSRTITALLVIKKAADLVGVRGVGLHFVGCCYIIKLSIRARRRPLLSENAQQQEQQDDDQRELYHEHASRWNRTGRLDRRTTGVKAGPRQARASMVPGGGRP